MREGDLGAGPVERRRALPRRDHRPRRRSAPRRPCSPPAARAALWARTTNPWGAIGAGPVMAHAAGADLADLELCQFHPTALAAARRARYDGPLITEAVRGEGATLLDADGERFTDELAPRDEVTRAVLDRMQADGADHVLLDLRARRARRASRTSSRPCARPASTRPASRSRSRPPRTT